jgi:hypothetical protein
MYSRQAIPGGQDSALPRDLDHDTTAPRQSYRNSLGQRGNSGMSRFLEHSSCLLCFIRFTCSQTGRKRASRARQNRRRPAGRDWRIRSACDDRPSRPVFRAYLCQNRTGRCLNKPFELNAALFLLCVLEKTFKRSLKHPVCPVQDRP